ncbi:MAG: hypothetical protein K0Q76_2301 [Panacagrimonas sp.]|jgi:hypothetical protein|nr:hypothetical protein [Panacagrimonas sp.]MCC2657193.1 hypothetical protein [Panacagrimonas sp.]
MRTTVAALLVLITCAWIGPSFADPPAHAPAHGWRAKQHRYTYYRDHEIYYSPESDFWFWMDRDGDWKAGVHLPVRLQQYTVGGISIELDSDKPYREHAYVVEHYGKGPKKKKKSKY